MLKPKIQGVKHIRLMSDMSEGYFTRFNTVFRSIERIFCLLADCRQEQFLDFVIFVENRKVLTSAKFGFFLNI